MDSFFLFFMDFPFIFPRFYFKLVLTCFFGFRCAQTLSGSHHRHVIDFAARRWKDRVSIGFSQLSRMINNKSSSVISRLVATVRPRVGSSFLDISTTSVLKKKSPNKNVYQLRSYTPFFE